MSRVKRDKFDVIEVKKYGNGGTYVPLTGIAKLGEKLKIEDFEDKIVLTRVKVPDLLENAIIEHKKNRYEIICKKCGQNIKSDISESIKKYGNIDNIKKDIDGLTHKDFGDNCDGCITILDKEQKQKKFEEFIKDEKDGIPIF